MPEGWEWDETLYRGSAPYYARGRLPYAAALAEELANALGLDGRGRLLDVGCGPGTLTLLLAHLFEGAVGVDPDPGMLTEAARRANDAGIRNVRWVQARGEELPLGLGTFRVATFAQSFHWMDRPRVAAVVRDMLDPGGVLVHVSDVKEPRDEPNAPLHHPGPPYDAIQELVTRYLGPVRRAGQGVLLHGTPGDEANVLHEAGFTGPEYLRVPAGGAIGRSVDDMVAWTFSMSGSAPHLFGARLAAFETDLRHLLHDAAPSGQFAERAPDTEVFFWRAPPG
jgi:SAM-dependent methyltransferase